MRKKALSLALALLMCLSLAPVTVAEAAWDGSSADSYDGGRGTRDDPYIISKPEQLAFFRDQVNKGSRYSAICAQLVNNIDMAMQDWTPIGLSSTGFRGVFDGNGYAIQNLKIDTFSRGTSVESGTLYGGGLFGIVGDEGTVRHVNVDGVVSTNETMTHCPDVGAVAGGNLGTIEECFSTCRFENFNLGVKSSGWVTIGGIVGFNKGVVRNCYMIGEMDINVNISGSVHSVDIGGIVGRIDINESIVENCYSVVSIEADITTTRDITACNIGGIIGSAEAGGTFRNLYTNAALCSSLTGADIDNYNYLESSDILSEDEMKSSSMIDKLGNAFYMDSENINQGYPVLAVMAYEEQPNESGWFTTEIKGSGLSDELIVSLTPSSLWRRDLTKKVTRVEFAELVVNLYEILSGTTLKAGNENPFTDISNDNILKAYNLGITKGTSATAFSPYSYISRQDMATMLARMYKKLNIEGWTLETDSSYTLEFDMPELFTDDELIAGYARDSVYFLAAYGIIRGSEDGAFNPSSGASGSDAGNATREQAIITGVRYYNTDWN